MKITVDGLEIETERQVEEEPIELNYGWISVQDRLPDLLQKVLFFLRSRWTFEKYLHGLFMRKRMGHLPTL